MTDYVRVEVVGSGDKVDKYLNEGWEIIETTKSAYPEGDTFLSYHIGLPAKVLLDNLLEIIHEYEKRGFKDKLFQAVAEENGEKIDDYETSGFFNVSTASTDFMEGYEKVVNNKRVSYFKRQEYSAPQEEDYTF